MSHDASTPVPDRFPKRRNGTTSQNPCLQSSALYPSLEMRDTVLKTGMERGAAISYDRLEEVAARLKGQ